MAKQKKSPTSFLFGFSAFASKAFSDSEPAMSPTSILDTKTFSILKSPVWTEPNTPTRTGSSKFDGEGVGLGIVDSITDITEKKLIVAKKPENSKVSLFGSQLKMIQIPNPDNNNTFSVDSPKSPMEFGMKTRNSQVGLLVSPNCSSGSPLNFNGSISSAEMEQSEDYTCVISRGGRVTKMTKIFDDCIVDSCVEDAVVCDSYSNKDVIQFQSFLSFCHTCRKNLGQGNDIYMYRGEKAFCSDECRRRQMLTEEKHGDLDDGSW